MDQEPHQSPPSQPSSYLRQVLVIRPPPVFVFHEQYISNKFQILKAYESPLSTHDFLKTYGQSIKVVLCSGVSPITTDVLNALPTLQLVVSATTGVNHIDMVKCRRRGVRVTDIGDLFDDVADGAVGLLMDVMRKITTGGGDRFVRGGCWPDTSVYPLVSKLGGKRVGIVGLGNIGSRVATRLEAMGCIVSYTSRHTKHPNSLHFLSKCPPTRFRFGCPCYLLCVDQLTNDTRHMVNNAVLRALGKTGVIVNVARGAIIDEVELVKCLVEGEIGGVGFDVFESEPNVPKELFKLDNVVLSSHNTAFTRECFHDAAQTMVANLEAFFMNKPLLTLVS